MKFLFLQKDIITTDESCVCFSCVKPDDLSYSIVSRILPVFHGFQISIINIMTDCTSQVHKSKHLIYNNL